MLTIFLKALAAAWGLFSWFRGSQQQRTGEMEQQNADLKSTEKEASDAQGTAEQVAHASDAQLDADLAKRMRDAGS